MILAELTIIPLSGAEMRPHVQTAVEIIKKSGLKYEVGALGTSLEGDLDTVLTTVKRIHHAVMQDGCERLLTELRIDERRTGVCTLAQEVAGFR